ncbi:hypothetical protein ACFE04_017154 [Oxalis oulophora]
MDSLNQRKTVLVMVAVNFAFGVVNVVLKKVLNEGVNQLVIITYRQAVSAIFLAPIAYFWERKTIPKLTISILFQLFISALVGATLTQYLFLIGLGYTSSTFSCAFINMVPVNTFLLALPFGLEKVNIKSKAGKAKVLGTVICIGGAMLLTLYKGTPLTHQHEISSTSIHVPNHEVSMNKKNWALGSLLLTAACLMWASWFLMQARIGKHYPCQYSSTAFLSFFSTIQSAILCFVIERDMSVWVVKGGTDLASIIYSGLVGSGLCYVAMAWCVKQRGPLFTSAFSPLVQIFAAMLDFSILHEQIYLGSILGSILVVIGLYILIWGKSKEAKELASLQSQVLQENKNCDQGSHVIPVTDE